jgi:energy-coupling factor transporter ATP-binding protein EcfA2
MDINLNELELGAPAAERDYALKDYFYESPSFLNLKADRKTVLLGNRGSGKSAIFKILGDFHKSKGSAVIQLNPEDYSYEILTRIMVAESAGSYGKQGAYSAAWKFQLLVAAMKELNKDYGKGGSAPAKLIHEFLRDNFKGEQTSPLDVLISYLKRMEGLKIGPVEATVKVRALQDLYKLEPIMKMVPALNELCRSRKVVIFVDELDKGWDSSEDAKNFVSGLFQAALWVNRTFPAFRVLISLRKELYDDIPSLYEDAQKVSDLIEVIEWDERGLLDMIAKRIGYNLAATRELGSSERWDCVFAETLEYRKTKSFNYIVDRTLYRPREIIQFCAKAVDFAKRMHAEAPLNYRVLSEAELAYSDERTKDIAAEYGYQYPGLSSVFECFRGKEYTLSREELEFLCLRITEGELPTAKNASTWLAGQDPQFLINVLWHVGFLRALAVGGVKARRRSGSQYLGSHQINSLNLQAIQNFQVHPMFRAHLAMREPKSAPTAEIVTPEE